MALKTSTGLRNGMLDSDSLKTQLDGGLINVYSGTVPATADDALGSATLLHVYSLNSTGSGISFDTAAVGDTISKAPGEVWAGNSVDTGVATFYRHVASGDTGALSTSEPRIQGTCGLTGGAEMIINTTFTASENRDLAYYSVTLPTL